MSDKPVIITPDEYKNIGSLFGDRGWNMMLPGFDMMLVTNTGYIPIERKAVPGDLVGSIEDGRLGRELVAMRKMSRFYVVILHGPIYYMPDGTMLTKWNQKRPWDDTVMRNVRRSLELVEGAIVEHAENDHQFVKIIYELQDYFDNKHDGFCNRSSLVSDGISDSYREQLVYFYSGLPGVKDGRGTNLADYFGLPGELLNASFKELMSVPGIGKKTARKIYNFLQGEK